MPLIWVQCPILSSLIRNKIWMRRYCATFIWNTIIQAFMALCLCSNKLLICSRGAANNKRRPSSCTPDERKSEGTGVGVGMGGLNKRRKWTPAPHSKRNSFHSALELELDEGFKIDTNQASQQTKMASIFPFSLSLSSPPQINEGKIGPWTNLSGSQHTARTLQWAN